VFTFINPDIIARLENGSFAPLRSESRNADTPGRRQTFSPLAMIKRCIRYESSVFQNRKSLILRLANGLNNPSQKITLIGGPQGCGKTSLTRGLVELMGSRNEQVLWFDVNRYTDFEEITHFLLHGIRDVFQQASIAATQSETSPSSLSDRRASVRDSGQERRLGNRGANVPKLASGTLSPPDSAPVLEQLAELIRQVSELPLLLVLDNVEYLVDPTLRFNSAPFKEVLNFLLGFPNIKMLLMGERLPYADMLSDQGGIEDIRLLGLEEADTLILLHARQKKPIDTASTQTVDPAVLEQATPPPDDTASVRQLYQKTQGAPWLLKILLHLNHQSNLDFFTLNRLLHSFQASSRREGGARGDDVIDSLLLVVDERLPDQQRALLQLLSFVRHPVNVPTLQAMTTICYPGMLQAGVADEWPSEGSSPATGNLISTQTLEDLLEHSLLRPLLKISYPPQDVLAHVRNRKPNVLPFRPGIRPGEATSPGASETRAFKPGYELYQTLKKLVYNHLPDVEKERMHRLLHDLYLRESSREAHNRILRIKNRVLLSEARFHEVWLHKHPGGLPQGLSGTRRSTESTAHFQAPKTIFPGFPGLLGADEDNSPPDGNLWKPPGLASGNTLSLSASANIDRFPLPSHDEDEWRFPDEYFRDEALLEGKEDTQHTHEAATAIPIEPISATTADQAPTTPWERFRQDNPKLKSLEPAQTKEASDLSEPEKALLKQLDAGIRTHNEIATAKAFMALARSHQGAGNNATAQHYLQQALTLQDAVPSDVQLAMHQMDGSIQKAQYQHNAALAAFKRAVRILEETVQDQDPLAAEHIHPGLKGHSVETQRKAGQLYAELGEIYAYRQQTTEAMASLEKALHAYTLAGDSLRLAEIHFQIGELHDATGQPQQAIRYYKQAVTEAQTSTSTRRTRQIASAALSNLGNLHLKTGEWEDAETAFNATLQADKESGDAEGQLNTLACLVTLYKKQNLWTQAKQTAHQGLTLAEKHTSAFWQATFHTKLGETYETQGQNTHARSHYQLAYATGKNELSASSLDWLAQKVTETGSA
jgi:tetratricopeptide (TPR) repeat protein/energy-coupling factor transporter ATP-binding protein EcfA2